MVNHFNINDLPRRHSLAQALPLFYFSQFLNFYIFNSSYLNLIR